MAMLAGLVNATGFLGLGQLGLSHMSGVATQLGVGLADQQLSKVADFLVIIASFLVGSMLSGYLLKSKALEVGRNYDWLLLIEGGLLFAAVYWFSERPMFGAYSAACACGLQNALATRYSGAVVRSTHLTGILTDIGMMLGDALRGREVDKREMLLFTLITVGFVLGAGLGSVFFGVFGFAALCVPAVSCWLLALVYRVYKKHIDANANADLDKQTVVDSEDKA